MNEVIKVGNRIRRASWSFNSFVAVTAVGRDKFLGVDEGGIEVALTCSQATVGTQWELAPELPRRYVVELRTPEVGERYAFGDSIITVEDGWTLSRRFVIVDEVTP